MSSFEPDPPGVDRSFRPLRLGERERTGFVPTVTRAGGRGGAAEPPACTDEQHAALEQAAFEKGLASAEADWARCERACDVFEAAAAELARLAPRMLRANRHQMIGLAAELARSWIGAELRLEPAKLEAPLDRALALLGDASAATIRLHPDVLAAFESALPERTAAWSDALEVSLIGDATLETSAFRIESATRTVDSALDTLASALREAIGDAFDAPASEGPAC